MMMRADLVLVQDHVKIAAAIDMLYSVSGSSHEEIKNIIQALQAIRVRCSEDIMDFLVD